MDLRDWRGSWVGSPLHGLHIEMQDPLPPNDVTWPRIDLRFPEGVRGPGLETAGHIHWPELVVDQRAAVIGVPGVPYAARLGPILGCPWVGQYPCDCPWWFVFLPTGGNPICPVQWIAHNHIHWTLPDGPREVRRQYCQVVINLARVALFTGAHEPLFHQLRRSADAMQLLYKSASLLTFTYCRAYSRADYEDSYAMTLSAALSGGPPSGFWMQRLRQASPSPPPIHSLRGSMDPSTTPALGIKLLRLQGLCHHAAVSDTSRALLQLLPQLAVCVVLDYWRGGYWDVREWREAFRHARTHLPLGAPLGAGDFPIIADYPMLREFRGMPRWADSYAARNTAAAEAWP